MRQVRCRALFIQRQQRQLVNIQSLGVRESIYHHPSQSNGHQRAACVVPVSGPHARTRTR